MKIRIPLQCVKRKVDLNKQKKPNRFALSQIYHTFAPDFAAIAQW